MTDTLPTRWKTLSLGEVCDVEMGQSPPSSTYNDEGVGLPFFQGKAEFGLLYPTPKKWCSRPTKVAEKDEVLVSVRAPVGPTNLAPVECCIGRGLAALRPRDGTLPKFILYQLRLLENHLDALGTGTTFKAISGKVLRELPVRWAPKDDQDQIVSKLEELFSDLDAGLAALGRAEANLARYRAAVLKAAVEGKLTEQWRRENPDVEPASELLRRILAERRKTCEEEHLAKYAGKGKRPPNGWRDQYVPPATPAMGNLPALPGSWCWATIDQLAASKPHAITDGPFGSNLKTAHYQDTGPRVIRLQNIGDGIFIDTPAHISAAHFQRLRRHSVEPGDVVIALLGTELPRACPVPDWIGDAIVKADCVKFSPNRDALRPLYASYALNAQPTRSRCAGSIRGVGRPRLNLSRIREIAVPLPPLPEQDQVILMVEALLGVADNVLQTVQATKLTVKELRSGILRRAFAGSLV